MKYAPQHSSYSPLNANEINFVVENFLCDLNISDPTRATTACPAVAGTCPAVAGACPARAGTVRVRANGWWPEQPCRRRGFTFVTFLRLVMKKITK